MRQRTIGEVFRLAREEQELSLIEIQEKTGIERHFLQAIEYNDFEYTDQELIKKYLGEYADFLDLDRQVILDAYEEGVELVIYDDVSNLDIKTRRSYKENRGKSIAYLPLIYLSVIALLIVCFVTYMVYLHVNQTSNQTISSSYQVSSESFSTSSESEDTNTESTTSSSENTESGIALTTTGTSSSLTTIVTGIEDTENITLSVTDVTSWISITNTDLSDGTVLSSTNTSVSTSLSKGSTYTITLGVVQGVTIKIGDQTLDTSTLTDLTGTITLTIE